MTTLALPLPTLAKGRFASIEAYTDEALFEACGVRIAFTTRAGGVSTGAYDSLNLGSHVDDDLALVQENRARVLRAFTHTHASVAHTHVSAAHVDADAAAHAGAVHANADTAAHFGAACADVTSSNCADPTFAACADTTLPNCAPHTPLIVPRQVHGDTVVTINDAKQAEDAQHIADEGADALVVGTSDVAALLCFADCVPVIAVLPTGRFAVIHAGWRGVENCITAKAIRLMAEQDGCGELISGCNVYFGPHIHKECFETGEEVHQRFVDRFGQSCVFDRSHIDLSEALRTQLAEIGVEAQRIYDIDKCTVCCNDEFFSYRAQQGIAGRHGAFAVRPRAF